MSDIPNVILPKEGDPTAGAPSKGGEYTDNCVNPTCGKRDIDRSWKFGGRDPKGEEHLMWSMYHCPPEQGGCGVNWSRTTRQGLEHYQQKGGKVPDKWLTKSASTGRYTSTPSDRFRENYERIDWSK